MKNKFSLLFPILTISIIFIAGCTGKKTGVTEIDEIILNAESLAGESVIIEGLCTHVCEKSGMKLFLKDVESEQTIRAESSATLGKFDPDCVDKYVRVRGTIVKDEQVTDSTHSHNSEVCEGEASAFQFHIAAEQYQIIYQEKL